MNRRLYFLLPDAAHTRSVVDELVANGIERKHIDAIVAKGVKLEGSPVATRNQSIDFGALVETVLWNGNLAVFFMALLALVVLAVMQFSWYWLIAPAAIMLATFLSGTGFARHIPNVHLSEFTSAISHREILLTIDVPTEQVDRVEKLVHRHPEAVTGGVGWHVGHVGALQA